jgi:hypothetical protein
MKRAYAVLAGVFLIGTFFLNTAVTKDEAKEIIVFYYFASTQFGYYAAPENIEKIKKIKTEFSEKYKKTEIKFVMVCLDDNLEKGLKFIRKHGYWDEISIGKSFGNELALNYLNISKIPKVPHILVFKDLHKTGKWNLPVIKERNLIVDLAGAEQIEEWIQQKYPLPFRKNSDESAPSENNKHKKVL